jgi:hypothetical protein
MATYAVLAVGPGGQPVWFGDPDNPRPFTITNTSATANIYIGTQQSVGSGNINESTQLQPGAYFSLDGTHPIYYVSADGPNATIQILPGVTSFFQPASLIQLGGVKIFVQASAPSDSPQIPVNSLWFDTSNGSLNIWTGTAWTNQQLNAQQLIAIATVTAAQIQDGTLTTTQLAAAAGILGTQIADATITSSNIAANTIVADNIAANTLTAAQLAAGIIYAGIVNGTEIDGSIFRAKNAYGATIMTINKSDQTWLLYKDEGSATQGPIIASGSGADGVDEFGNNYYHGVAAISSTAAVLLQDGNVYMAPTLADMFSPNQQSGLISSVPGGGTTLLGVQNWQSGGDSTDTPALIELASAHNNAGTPALIFYNGTELLLQTSGGPFVDNEGWHDLTLPSGLTGYARVKLVPWNGVWLDVQVSGSAGVTYDLGALPASVYYPLQDRHIPFAPNNNEPGRIFMPTTGGPQLIVNGSGSFTGGTSIVYPTN